MRSRTISLIASFIVCLIATTGQAANWPQWMGPNRNGISSDTDWNQDWPKSGLETLWQTNVGTGFSAPSVQGDLLFTMGHEEGIDTIYCLHSETGEEIWTHSYPCNVHDYQHEGGPAATPAIDGDRVYTLSRDGHLFCFESSTGKILWMQQLHDRFQPEWPLFGYVGSPVVTGNLVIVDVGPAVVLDKKTGEIVWNSENFRSTCASPQLATIDGKELVSLFNATGFILFEVKTGMEFCRKPWTTPKFDTNTATPVFQENKVFISSGYDRGCALLEIEGNSEPKIVWQDEDARTYHNTFLLIEGHLYGFIEENLVCLEFLTGKKLWQEKWVGKGCQIEVGGKMLVYSEKGELVLGEASPEGFNELGRTHNIGGRCWTPPVLANGLIYLRNSKGLIACLDARQD